MKKLLATALFGFAIVFNSISAPASAEQLRSDFESALEAGDTNAILSLFDWKGVPIETKSKTIEEMMDMVSSRDFYQNVEFQPLTTDFQITNELDGVRYFPNVHVFGVIRAHYFYRDILFGLTWPYGEDNGAFYIAGIVQEVFDPHAKKSISLGLTVNGIFSKENPGILNTTYVYVSVGKEKTISSQYTIQRTNNWMTGFLGDYIKSCKITKISGSGSFQLTINENERQIFDSGMLETNDSISYERKQQ